MKMQAWDVFLDGNLVDTVFYNPAWNDDYVRLSLINHDGYNQDIVVKKQK